ncbi:MAG: DnaJ C-terminal domain-containing protein [Phycisphaerales bacterium]|jgi:DnaJ-class molecular chaperone|nr:DnaJ C-terminal domain-containing protein [Phycisphaerales bacterium]
MSLERDPYEVLGVSKSATDDEIRRAYRKLARTHHPDVSTEADADKRFAEVQEAYEVLSDAEKRAAYDRFGRVGGPTPGAAGGPGGFGGGWEGQQVDPSQFNDIFEQMFGGGAAPGGFGQQGRATGRPASRRGIDQTKTITVTFKTAALGGTEHVVLDDGTQFDVQIPAGIEDGSKLRLRGRGGAGSGGGERGDLIVMVHVGGHPYFKRQGSDLLVDVPITIAEAGLGTSVDVSLMKGSVTLRIPPGSSSGTRLRVRGQGIAKQSGERGDLYAVVQIVAPSDMPDEVRDHLIAMQASLPDPRIDTPGVESAQTRTDS